MKIQYGMDVLTYDGKKVGTVDQIVVNPTDENVTDIVVQKGLLFKSDRTIPVDEINNTTAGEIQLKSSTDLRSFPEFNADFFVPALRDDLIATYAPGTTPDATVPTAPLLYYPPISNMRRRPLDPRDEVKQQYGELPPDAVRIQDGADIVSHDNRKVGNVEAVFADDLGQITHMMISKGTVFTEEKVLPISWVEVVNPHTVRLQVRTSLVEALPAFN